MSEHEDSGLGRLSNEAKSPPDPDIIPRDGETQGASQSPPDRAGGAPARMLAVVPLRLKPEWLESEPIAPPGTFLRTSLAAAAAVALAAVIGAAGVLVNEHNRQNNLLAVSAHETESLAQSVKALGVRLDAIERAKSRDDIVELRRSIGELKSGIASGRDLGGALAQLSQRLEKLDHDESVKVDKLGERVDRDTSTRNAELSARIEKLERRAAAPIGVAQSIPTPPSRTKPPALALRSGSNVSMETTGSIQRQRPVLQGYIVLDARYDAALIGGRYGEREVRPGDFLPGAGRVERIERRGDRWVVLTNEGLIAAAETPPD